MPGKFPAWAPLVQLTTPMTPTPLRTVTRVAISHALTLKAKKWLTAKLEPRVCITQARRWYREGGEMVDKPC